MLLLHWKSADSLQLHESVGVILPLSKQRPYATSYAVKLSASQGLFMAEVSQCSEPLKVSNERFVSAACCLGDTRFPDHHTHTVKYAASALDRRWRGGFHLKCTDCQGAQDYLDESICKKLQARDCVKELPFFTEPHGKPGISIANVSEADQTSLVRYTKKEDFW